MAFRFSIHRRWLRISTRTLLLIVLVISVVLGYVSHRARKQEQLVRRLATEQRASFGFRQDKNEYGSMIPESAIHGPKWLRRLVGDHAFATIYRVNTFRVSEDDLRLLSDFPTIEYLTLDEGVRDEGMRYVGRLRNLKELEVRSPHITDKTLSYLSRLRKLEHLRLDFARISDEGLRHLANLKDLKELSFQSTQITSDGVAWLRQRFPKVKLYPRAFASAPEEREAVQQLIKSGARFLAHKDGYVQWVTFYGKEMEDDHLAPLESLKRLEGLGVAGTRVTVAGIERLRQKHPALKVSPEFRRPMPEEAQAVAALQKAGLGLFFNKEGHVSKIESLDADLDPESLAAISELRHVKRIELSLKELGENGAEYLGAVNSLEALELRDTELKDADFAQLSRLANLKLISASAPHASDEGIGALGSCASLRNLILLRVTIRGPGLAKLKNVINLNLSFQPSAALSDEGLAHVAGLTQLVGLSFRFIDVSDEGLEHLKNLANLRSLSLQGGSVTDEGLVGLSKLPKLKSLSLYEMRLTPDGRDRFKELRPDCNVSSTDWL
jgi:Leucine-rich repeat (LRR) protein